MIGYRRIRKLSHCSYLMISIDYLFIYKFKSTQSYENLSNNVKINNHK